MSEITKTTQVPRRFALASPALAVLALLLFLPSLAFAASNTGSLRLAWRQYTGDMSITQQQKLPNGNTLVGVRAKECNQFGGQPDSLSTMPAKKDTQVKYYEIDKTINTLQAIQFLNERCMGSLAYTSLEDFIKTQRPAAGQVLSAEILPIKSVTADSVTVIMSTSVKKVYQLPLNQSAVLQDVFGKKLLPSDFSSAGMTTVIYSLPQNDWPACPDNGANTESGDCPRLSYSIGDMHPNQKALAQARVVALLKMPAVLNGGPNSAALDRKIYDVVPCSQSLNGFCASGPMSPDGHYHSPVPFVTMPWVAIGCALVGVVLATWMLVSRHRRVI